MAAPTPRIIMSHRVVRHRTLHRPSLRHSDPDDHLRCLPHLAKRSTASPDRQIPISPLGHISNFDALILRSPLSRHCHPRHVGVSSARRTHVHHPTENAGSLGRLSSGRHRMLGMNRSRVDHPTDNDVCSRNLRRRDCRPGLSLSFCTTRTHGRHKALHRS